MTITSPYAPMLLGIVGAALALLLAAWGRRGSGMAAAVYGLALGAAVAGQQAFAAGSSRVIASGGVVSLTVAACLGLGAAVVAGSSATLERTGAGVRIAALAAIAASAAAFVSASADLLALFLGVETLALAGYGLVAAAGTPRSREAAMKWFVQGSVATLVFLAGIAVLIGQTGGRLSYLALGSLAAAGSPSLPLAVGSVLVFSALAFKAGAFPFHAWMPDAFETGPVPGIAVLASVGKIAPLAAALTLVVAVSGPSAGRIDPVAAVLATASIVFGNLGAIRQRSLARMLAYSGIAQVGYAFSGLVAGGGTYSVLVFALLYGVTSAASFLFIVAMQESEPGWDGRIDGLAGLSRRRPALAVSLAVIMFSLTGIPLTAGFWGKLLVFSDVASHGYVWLAVLAMLASVASFAFYGGVLRTAFMAEPAADEAGDGAEAGPAPERGSADDRGEARPARLTPSVVATAVLAVVILAIGIVPFLVGTPLG